MPELWRMARLKWDTVKKAIIGTMPRMKISLNVLLSVVRRGSMEE